MTVYQGRRGAKQLQRDAHQGMRLYVVSDNAARYPGAPRQTYSEYVVQHRSPITGNWMTGSNTVQHLLTLGEVHDSPPPGIPNVAERRPDRFRPEMGGGSWNDQLADAAKQSRLADERRKRGF